MGVDFTIIKTTGLLILEDHLPQDIHQILNEGLESDIPFLFQSQYTQYDPNKHPPKYYLFQLRFVDDKIETSNNKVIYSSCRTPYSDVYDKNNEFIKGGANIPFVVKYPTDISNDVTKYNIILYKYFNDAGLPENIIKIILDKSEYGKYLFSFFC